MSFVFLAPFEGSECRLRFLQNIIRQSIHFQFLPGDGSREELIEGLMVVPQVIAFVRRPARLSLFEKADEFGVNLVKVSL